MNIAGIAFSVMALHDAVRNKVEATRQSKIRISHVEDDADLNEIKERFVRRFSAASKKRRGKS